MDYVALNNMDMIQASNQFLTKVDGAGDIHTNDFRIFGAEAHQVLAMSASPIQNQFPVEKRIAAVAWG